MSDFVGSYQQTKANKKQMALTEQANEDILNFLRENLGYQKELMQWQKDMYTQERTERLPYMESSKRSLVDLEAMTKGDFDITSTKSYQTKEKALEQSLNKSLAAKGLTLSGYGVEEEARLKSGLMIGEEQSLYSKLSGVVNVGTMGMVQTPMLANTGAINENYGNMGQVPAWYASQMGGIYQRQANISKDMYNQSSGTVMSILGGYLGGGSGMCWVAEELYGKSSYKTHIVRRYVNRHISETSIFGSFCRLYSKHGIKWASWVKKNKTVRIVAKVIWDYLYKKALKEEPGYGLFISRI